MTLRLHAIYHKPAMRADSRLVSDAACAFGTFATVVENECQQDSYRSENQTQEESERSEFSSLANNRSDKAAHDNNNGESGLCVAVHNCGSCARGASIVNWRAA